MKAVKFKNSNVIFAKDQPQYLQLPAWRNENDPQGFVVTCYKLNFWECLHVLIFRRVYFATVTFRKPLQPQRPSVKNPVLEIAREVEINIIQQNVFEWAHSKGFIQIPGTNNWMQAKNYNEGEPILTDHVFLFDEIKQQYENAQEIVSHETAKMKAI